MSYAYELECISRIVQTGQAVRHQHILKSEYFNTSNAEIVMALMTFEKQYGAVMDEPTFRMQFPDFDWSPNENQVEWYADELAQSFVEEQVRKIMDDTNAELANDPKKTARDTFERLQKLQQYIGDPLRAEIGLADQVFARIERIRARRTSFAEELGIAGTTTGLRLIDEISGGTHPGEIELYVARPGVGKTQTLLYGAYCAWMQGKKISIISPEMNAWEVGLRFDAFHFHNSQRRMLQGTMTDEEMDEFTALAEEMQQQMKHDIKFRDAESLHRRFNVADVRKIVTNDQCDILIIDGLLLVDPVYTEQDAKIRPDVRIRLLRVMEDLKSIVAEQQVAIRAAHQANRETEQRGQRRQNAQPGDGLPELWQLAESGSTEQYANRVITMDYRDGRMWFAVRKNRNGPQGRLLSADFNFDRGIVSQEQLEGEERDDQPVQVELLTRDEQADRIF